MKPPRSPRGGRLTILTITLLGLYAQAFAETKIPRGTLCLVRNTTSPRLDWRIDYPSDQVTGIVEVTDKGTLVPKSDHRMKVRVLGTSDPSGHMEASWVRNDGEWMALFSGSGSSVPGTEVLVNEMVKTGDRIDFRARFQTNSSWSAFLETRPNDRGVTVLKNGDRTPDHFHSGAAFLKPHLGSDGSIQIGNKDLIILWSFSAPETRTLGLLVTFE